MSRHILLLTDFSADSERAFAPTVELANLLSARITLLHVVETAILAAPGPLAPSVATAGALAEREVDAKRRLLDLSIRFPRECEVRPTIIRGPDAATAACAFAAEHAIDMIAMASHGRSGLRRFVMGSVAENVLRKAGMPVLVFPQTRTAAQQAMRTADGRGATAR